ncbi:MAG: hypothetical protein BAJALOKI2v1_50035 [Promethearchaeota archaeon]|nr:MAG: hypothetical protein BAJALOKI2v1_50035 [Candidatus Lokiarchaeota archaeon]
MSEKKTELQKDNELIFFNEAYEYVFGEVNEKSFTENSQSTNLSQERTQLRDQMLDELEKLKELILNNPDKKIKRLTEEEKEFFYEFVGFWTRCPICKSKNHYYNLKRLFFDEDKQKIRDQLIHYMNLRKEGVKIPNLKLGVPCCSCYKRYFGKE